MKSKILEFLVVGLFITIWMLLLFPLWANATTYNYIGTNNSSAAAIIYGVSSKTDQVQIWTIGDGFLTASLDTDTGKLDIAGSLNAFNPNVVQGPDWFFEPLEFTISQTYSTTFFGTDFKYNDPVVLTQLEDVTFPHSNQFFGNSAFTALSLITQCILLNTGNGKTIEGQHYLYFEQSDLNSNRLAAFPTDSVPEPMSLILLVAAIGIIWSARSYIFSK